MVWEIWITNSNYLSQTKYLKYDFSYSDAVLWNTETVGLPVGGGGHLRANK